MPEVINSHPDLAIFYYFDSLVLQLSKITETTKSAPDLTNSIILII